LFSASTSASNENSSYFRSEDLSGYTKSSYEKD